MNDKLTYTCRKILEYLKDGTYREVPHWASPCHMKSLLSRGYIERKAGHSVSFLCQGEIWITTKGLERLAKPW